MKINIFTNEVAGGWEPSDLKDGLGGSEEAVILLAEALSRKYHLAGGNQVTVYHTQKKPTTSFEYHGVIYQGRGQAKCDADEVFITFKDNHPWITGLKTKVNIHWTADVERPWDTKNIDYFVNLSPFHELRNLWVPPAKSKVIPLGIDIDSLKSNQQEKYEEIMLYCSSPDRGLETLLKDWEAIKKVHPSLELYICYGNETNLIYRFRSLLDQDSIHLLGRIPKSQVEELYWKAKYWCLPLNIPDSELFCLNAVKARSCGTIPVVHKIGALQDTVGSYIPYDNFVKGHTKLQDVTSPPYLSRIYSWDEIVEKYWLPLFEGK